MKTSERDQLFTQGWQEQRARFQDLVLSFTGPETPLFRGQILKDCLMLTKLMKDYMDIL